MLISHVQVAALLPAQARAPGWRQPRTAAEATALVRRLNRAEEGAREREEAERRRRDAEIDQMARQAKALIPASRTTRPPLSIEDSYPEPRLAKQRRLAEEAAASRKGLAASAALPRTAQATPARRRTVMDVAAIYRQRTTPVTNVFDLYRERDARRLASQKGA
jgi:hypothetical protein